MYVITDQYSDHTPMHTSRTFNKLAIAIKYAWYSASQRDRTGLTGSVTVQNTVTLLAEYKIDIVKG